MSTMPVEPVEEDAIAFQAHARRLGARLKTIRKQKMLTITQLALYTGLSVGYLSNVERGQSSPTVQNLSRICKELGVSMVDVLNEAPRSRDLIRKDEARSYERPNVAMAIRVYDFGGGMDAFEAITIGVGCDHIDAEAMHPYPEMVYVKAGQLTVTIEGEDFVLEEGDALCVRANHKHTLSNRGDVPCESVWLRMTSTMVTNLM